MGFTHLQIERNPWLGCCRPQTHVLSALSLNCICWTPTPPPTTQQISWVRHCFWGKSYITSSCFLHCVCVCVCVCVWHKYPNSGSEPSGWWCSFPASISVGPGGICGSGSVSWHRWSILISAFCKNESIQLLPTLGYRKDVAVCEGMDHTPAALVLNFLTRKYVFVIECYTTKWLDAIFLHFQVQIYIKKDLNDIHLLSTMSIIRNMYVATYLFIATLYKYLNFTKCDFFVCYGHVTFPLPVTWLGNFGRWVEFLLSLGDRNL
jgi:hypothetical protein